MEVTSPLDPPDDLESGYSSSSSADQEPLLSRSPPGESFERNTLNGTHPELFEEVNADAGDVTVFDDETDGHTHVRITSQAKTDVFELDSIIFTLRFFRVSPQRAPCGCLPDSHVWPEMRLNGAHRNAVLFDALILILIMAVFTIAQIIALFVLGPTRHPSFSAAEVAGYVFLALPLYAFAMVVFCDLHASRGYLARVFQLQPRLFEKARLVARLLFLSALVLTAAATATVAIRMIYYINRNDSMYSEVHPLKTVATAVAACFAVLVSSCLLFSCLASFLTLVITIRSAFGMLGRDLKVCPIRSQRDVTLFMKKHSALIILIQRCSESPTRVIPLAVAFIVTAISSAVGLASFIYSGNPGLIWPFAFILPIAFLILGSLAWLGGASKTLKREFLQMVARENFRTTGQTDPALITPLITYLDAASDTYWSILVDITPTLVGTLFSLVVSAGTVVVPLVLKFSAPAIVTPSSTPSTLTPL